MTTNLRNHQLLEQVKTHPLGKTLAAAFDSSEAFEGDLEALSINQNYSPQGRANKRREKLAAAVRDNRDLRGPVNELQAKLDAKRAAVQRPPLDRTNQVAVDDRRELRTILRGMERGQRALLLCGAGADPEFQDAMLEVSPLLSGLMPEEKFLVDAAREERLAGLYGPQLAEITELETTIADANMIFDLALNDLKLHSEMDDRAFAEFSKPIMNRRGAPWKMNDGKTICEIGSDGKAAYHLGSEDELRDAVAYPDEAAYLAAR
jgi:hypothetical protein